MRIIKPGSAEIGGEKLGEKTHATTQRNGMSKVKLCDGYFLRQENILN
jgi:hypothetical protein